MANLYGLSSHAVNSLVQVPESAFTSGPQKHFGLRTRTVSENPPSRESKSYILGPATPSRYSIPFSPAYVAGLCKLAHKPINNLQDLHLQY
jgi:hypothetical protein